MSGVVDAVANLFTPEVVQTRPNWSAGHMSRRFSVGQEALKGVDIESQLSEMDRAGVDMAILVVQRMGSPGSPGHWAMSPQPVIEAVAAYPNRFAAQIGIDPTGGSAEVRRLRSAVERDGFVGAHLYPHWFDLSPDDPVIYPFYEACSELGIPIQVQVGQALRYAGNRPIRSVGLPMTLEPVATSFPDLKLIGSHLGYPWVDEMIALSSVYPNVFICTDSHAPKHWPASLNRYVSGDGGDKVMFGTMWPTIPFQRAVEEIGAKDLPPDRLERLLGGTASEVYELKRRT